MRLGLVETACTLCASLLLACASVTPIEDSSGRRLYLIRCEGFGVPISVCLARAKQECPLGYRLLQVSGRSPDREGTHWAEDGTADELPVASSGRYVIAECEGEG